MVLADQTRHSICTNTSGIASQGKVVITLEAGKGSLMNPLVTAAGVEEGMPVCVGNSH